MNNTAIIGAAALLAGSAAGQTSLIQNGGFEDGLNNWIAFGNGGFNDGSTNPDPAGLLDNNHYGLFGQFSGAFNVSGVAQELVGWQFGDIIQVAVEGYTSSGDSIAGTSNEFFVAINVFDAAGNFWFNVPSVGVINGSNAEDTLFPLTSDFFIDPALQNSLGVSKLEIAIVFIQQDGSFDGGSVLFDNASAIIIPAPGAAAGLGLAGLMAARRRR